ncbi:hypothetical protein [Alkalicoccobacillus gibsonii]|uniref:hypothetical protein n=1 Tax=Alkalicoccobacillus gibsonii TaxID=79881 RepID=UPI001934358E|nr:hypothetical protein [Alkalicoccobacillus gibsonii]MBM0064945.1 hypothetical protein [Alkalicoccobacillus gibsonii]
MGKIEDLDLTSINPETGETTFSIKVKGESEMPFWKHDLSIKAAIKLLSTVNVKDFETQKELELHTKLMNELREIVDYADGL